MGRYCLHVMQAFLTARRANFLRSHCSDIITLLTRMPWCAGTPMGSRPASMDYGRRDMPLQGIAENRDEGVGAHPVTFDSGSEMGSEMGSRPTSEPPSPRAGGKVGEFSHVMNAN